MPDAVARDHRQDDPAGRHHERGLAHRAQALGVGLEAGEEHQQDHADLRQVPDEHVLPDEAQRRRPVRAGRRPSSRARTASRNAARCSPETFAVRRRPAIRTRSRLRYSTTRDSRYSAFPGLFGPCYAIVCHLISGRFPDTGEPVPGTGSPLAAFVELGRLRTARRRAAAQRLRHPRDEGARLDAALARHVFHRVGVRAHLRQVQPAELVLRLRPVDAQPPSAL